LIKKANKLYLTHSHHQFEADTFFPWIGQKAMEKLLKKKILKPMKKTNSLFLLWTI